MPQAPHQVSTGSRNLQPIRLTPTAEPSSSARQPTRTGFLDPANLRTTAAQMSKFCALWAVNLTKPSPTITAATRAFSWPSPVTHGDAVERSSLRPSPGPAQCDQSAGASARYLFVSAGVGPVGGIPGQVSLVIGGPGGPPPGAAADWFARLSIWPVPVRREGDRPGGRLAPGPSRPSDRGGSHVSGDHADDQRGAGQGDAAARRRLEARAGGP